MIDASDPHLTAYVLDELSAADRAAVEAALEQSPELRRAVDEIRQAAKLLSDTLQSEPCPALTPQQHAAIESESRAAALPATAPIRSASSANRWIAIVSVAAALLLMIGGGLWYSRDGGARRTAAFSDPDSSGAQAPAEQSAPSTDDFGDGMKDADFSNGVAAGSSGAPVDELSGAVRNQAIAPPANEPASADGPLTADRRSSTLEERQVNQMPLQEMERFGQSQSDPDAPGEATAAPSLRSQFGGGQPGAPSAAYSSNRPQSVSGSGGGDARGRLSSGDVLGGRAGGFGGGGLGGRGGSQAGQGGAMPMRAGAATDDSQGLRGFDAYSAGDAQMAPQQGQETGGLIDPAGIPAGTADLIVRERDRGELDGRDLQRRLQPDAFQTLESAVPQPARNADALPATMPASGAPPGAFSRAKNTADSPVIAETTVERLRTSGEGGQQGGRQPAGRSEAFVGKAADRQALSAGLDAEQPGGGEAEAPAAEKSQPRSWRRVRATPNASRLMIGDNDELPLEGLQASVQIDGFRARVVLDCYYYNDRGRQLEGDFKLRLPNDASLYYFAFGQSAFEYRPMVDQLVSRDFLPPEIVRTSGTGPAGILRARSESWTGVKEARIVPRQKAAHAYSETVRRRVDPALVEWSGAGVFNARVYPLLPDKLHRIVIGYDVNLAREGEDLVYQLDLPQSSAQKSVDVSIAALPGSSAEVAPQVRPFASGGRAFYHFDNPQGEGVSVRMRDSGVTLLTGRDAQAGEFFAARFTPELAAGDENVGSPNAIFLVDTSLSANPDKFNVWLNMLRAVLDNNRDSIESFAVLFFNIEAHWWKQEFTKNTADNVDALIRDCNTLALEGATDLQLALSEATRPGALRVAGELETPDLFLLSDGAVTWGETNLHLIAKALRSENAGALFAYNTGLTGTSIGVLDHLARESGGAVFSVATEQEIAAASTAHRRRPWELLATNVAGGSDLLIAGRPKSIYPGQQLLVTGRGEPVGDVTLQVRRGQQRETVRIAFNERIESEMAARAYGQTAVGQLEDLAPAAEDVAVAYARHFRVPGQTCSLLMLDSEADYARFNIKPEDDAIVVASSSAVDIVNQKLDELADRREDPKQALLAWLSAMENAPGVQFRAPTALRLVVEGLPPDSFDIRPDRILRKDRGRESLSKAYFQTLDAQELNYDHINQEAARRLKELGPADALTALSNLVEHNPGDVVLARDVAFSAMDWELPGQAYPLLLRVARLRPFEPQVYPAIGQCLAQMERADLALVYYEAALAGQWHDRYQDVRQIAAAEYAELLRRIDRGELSSHAPQYARARLQSLAGQFDIGDKDLVVTMLWNTDRTDVDLHVVEPSGEECFYQHRTTTAGGQITRDVTEGFGPEMYSIHKAPAGRYQIFANYYGSDANRTAVRSKVYLTIYENYGAAKPQVTRRTVSLSTQSEKRNVATIVVEK